MKKNQNTQPEEQTIELMDLLILFAKQMKIIIIFPFILCSISIIYLSFFAQPIYTSTSKIMSSTGGTVSQAAGIAAQFGINIPSNNTEQKWVYPEILRSRTLAREIIKKNFILNNDGTEKTLLDILTNGIKKNNSADKALESHAIDRFLSMIEIYENVTTSILTLKINTFDPVFASQLNQALIQELDSHQRKYNKAKTSEAKIFIEERIIDVEKELVTAEENLKVFVDRNRRIENSPSLQLIRQRLSREVTVLTGVFTTLKQQLETTKIEEVKESNYVVVLDKPEIPLKRSKPNKKSTVLIMGIIGLSLGIFSAFIKDFLENRDDESKNKLLEAKYILVNNIRDIFSFRLTK